MGLRLKYINNLSLSVSWKVVDIFELNSQWNYTPLFHAPGWLAGIAYGHYVCFPIIEPGLCKNTGVFAQTLNTQLEDHDGQYAQFDKKGMGLELWTVPLTVYVEML